MASAEHEPIRGSVGGTISGSGAELFESFWALELPRKQQNLPRFHMLQFFTVLTICYLAVTQKLLQYPSIHCLEACSNN